MPNLILSLSAVMLAASLPPPLVMAGCLAAGLPLAQGLLLSALAALLSAALGVWLVLRGLARPVESVTGAAKSFVTAGFKLESPLPKTGWPAASALISVLNRLMLELSAYRAFHLNEVLDDRAKAQALIETITDGVLLADDTGQVLYANQRAMTLLGIPKLVSGLVIPASIKSAEFLPRVEEMLKSPENIFKTEVTLLGEDGDFSSAKSYALLARHFKLATLKRPGRVMVLRDITTEKEIENARETFFHMLTHDMRAPLASIQGYAQMLEKQVGKDPLTESGKYLTAILRSSKRLNGMIEDILNTIKLERGEITLSPAPLDAAALCADLFEVYDPLAARKNITFRTEAPPGLKFTGDQRLLERVMANLLGNAIKFTPAAGKLTLACARDGDGVRFLVEDTGPGIPADRHEEIFEKYTQMEEHKHLGFGLGLAMCKLAVELHKGRIWVESEPGKGSRFYVALPGAQT